MRRKFEYCNNTSRYDDFLPNSLSHESKTSKWFGKTFLAWKIVFKSGISITWSSLLYIQCWGGSCVGLFLNGLKSFLTDNSCLRTQTVKYKSPSPEGKKGTYYLLWVHPPRHEFLNCQLSQFDWMYHTYLKHKHTESTKQEMWYFVSKKILTYNKKLLF